MSIFDNLDFLGFVKQVLEEKIQKQEALIDVERANFFDKQLDYKLSKELHMYQRWRDEISSYITNKMAGDNPNMNMKELLERNQALLEQNQKLLKRNNPNMNMKELLERNQSLIEQNQKLLKRNKELEERIEELKLEVNLLNNDIKRFIWKLYNLK